MKKITSVLAAILLVAALGSTTAFAYGHCGSRTATPQYTVCNIESCTLTGQHTHRHKTYTAHYYGDGHDYHGVCGFSECTLTGYHEHDGTYCFGYDANDGRDNDGAGGCRR